MKNSFAKWAAALLCLVAAMPAQAQFNLKKAISGAAKVTQAATLTDEQMAAYVKEYIDWMDEHNPVCADDDPYTLRLNRLTEGLTDADGIALNFKVYYVIDVNAFACADGSIRVFSSLMDIMTDEELLGVIGHEVGHIAHRDSKKGFRTALLASALRDGISSNGGKAAQLSESQLGDLGEALANATYSQKQERDADDYGLLVPTSESDAGRSRRTEKQQNQPAVLDPPRPGRSHQTHGRTRHGRWNRRTDHSLRRIETRPAPK